MTMKLGPQVVDSLLLGTGGRRRELQDFPVLGDVWARFADLPGERHDLLISPTWEKPTGTVANLIAETLLVDVEEAVSNIKDAARERDVAYLQDLVVASLTLDELTGIALPATSWWDGIEDQWTERSFEPSPEELGKWITLALQEAIRDEKPPRERKDEPEADGLAESSTEDRQVAKLGLLLGVLRAAAASAAGTGTDKTDSDRPVAAAESALGGENIADKGVAGVLLVMASYRRFGAAAREAAEGASTVSAAASDAAADEAPWKSAIFQVSLNREATPAITESVAAIKADAAISLFSITCKDINWAVLDSGIDQNHRAFWDYEKIWKEREQREAKAAGAKAAEAKAARDARAAADANPGSGAGGGTAPKEDAPPPAETAMAAAPTAHEDEVIKAPEAFRPHRIKATFDFRRIRAIMSVGAIDHDKLVEEIASESSHSPEEIKEKLGELAADRKAGSRVDWAKVKPMVERRRPRPPTHPHGTHVAGILGAHWLDFKRGVDPERSDPVKMDGVCPDIALYDFRVLGANQADSEFAVIAALQFIRFLNDQSGYSVIDGVNMSLSIPHNVRNYACGWTQVCIESESLVSNGVVVVAAAGNRGFQQYRLADNTMFESYAASSITDPGNAEGVITVGSTHRHWPHTYGVSFFSSRGPTGDGRLKPDLLAPGEKIVSCIPGNREDQMDGTSMAAPHVSGAAALLMGRHQELKGQPVRIKQILCETATDLNRERSFQGHGMVDVLRAIQSV